VILKLMEVTQKGLAIALALFLIPFFLRGQEEAAEKAEYMGSEMCEACHSDIYESFQKNPHIAVETDEKRGWQGRACESCHGPGSKHIEEMTAESIVNPAKIPPMRADEGCLTCHLNQPTHAGRIRGSHARNQIACVACHPVHGTEEVTLRPHPRQKINQQCADCHPAAWASFQRPHAHKLPQGAMSCVDCHNPHGSFLPRNQQVVSANEPGCFRCHSNLRGPFVFEHAPVRLEGCQSCHEPHGSANPRMLTRHEVSNLCLECHSNLPGAGGAVATGAMGDIPTGNHDLRSPRFRNCTLCHVKIHGSHVNRDFLR
jgi:DmsE family decaheme c-type cytochrome